MKNLLLVMFAVIFSLMLLPSCTVYEADTAYEPVNTVPAYYTMQAYDDRYVFYSGAEPVAVWRFGPDGIIYKEGIVINGPVRVYSQPNVLFAETYYTNGVRDGACRYYYPNGAVMYSGYYNHGYISGSWNSYNVSGEVAASYHFNGTETTMPSNFQPPSNQTGRVGFMAMQKETTYAGTQPVVSQTFNKANAVPANYKNSFGAVSPANTGGVQQGQKQGTVGIGALKQQGGQVQAQNAPVQQNNQQPNVQGQQPGMMQNQQQANQSQQNNNQKNNWNKNQKNKGAFNAGKNMKKQKAPPANKPKPAKKKGKKEKFF